MIGAPDRIAADDEPAATEALQLVPLGERLPDALETLGPHADELPGAEQPLDVLVAGKRCAALSSEVGDEGQLKDEVGAEHP